MDHDQLELDDSEEAVTDYAYCVIERLRAESISINIQIVLAIIGLVVMFSFHTWWPALAVCVLAVLVQLSVVGRCRRLTFRRTGMPYHLQGLMWLSWKDNPAVAQKVFEHRLTKSERA